MKISSFKYEMDKDASQDAKKRIIKRTCDEDIFNERDIGLIEACDEDVFI